MKYMVCFYYKFALVILLSYFKMHYYYYPHCHNLCRLLREAEELDISFLKKLNILSFKNENAVFIKNN